MGVMQMYVPMPTEEIYRTLGPVRKKLSRILLYIVRTKARDAAGWNAYVEAHNLLNDCWRAAVADRTNSEFCEQTELDLAYESHPTAV